MDNMGQVAFTEAQRQTALTILEDHDAKKKKHSYPNPEPVPVETEKVMISRGTVCLYYSIRVSRILTLVI